MCNECDVPPDSKYLLRTPILTFLAGTNTRYLLTSVSIGCLHTAVTDCVGYRTGIAGEEEDGYSGRCMPTHAGLGQPARVR